MNEHKNISKLKICLRIFRFVTKSKLVFDYRLNLLLSAFSFVPSFSLMVLQFNNKVCMNSQVEQDAVGLNWGGHRASSAYLTSPSWSQHAFTFHCLRKLAEPELNKLTLFCLYV